MMGANNSHETGRVTTWLPFSGEGQALAAMAAYAQHINCPQAAIIWADPGGAKLLRQGSVDKDGDVPVLIAHAHGPVQPPPVAPKPQGALQSFEAAAASVFASVESGAKSGAKWAGDEVSAGWQKAKSGLQSASHYIDQHPLAFDGASVAFDCVAVIGGAIAIATFGVAGVGALGMVAIGAGVALLLADGTHYALELAAQKYKTAADMQKIVDDSGLYRTVEWIAPLLCLPDLVVNLPASIREAGAGIREAKAAATEAEEGAEATAHAEQKLDNYMQKRSADGAPPPVKSTQQRYQRQINAAKRAEAALQAKFTTAAVSARKHEIGAAISVLNVPGTNYGAGMLAVHPPEKPGWMDSISHAAHSALNSAATHWHDLTSHFVSASPTYPVMPDANERVFHHGFRGGYSTRRGDDPWTDMQSYLSIHLAMTRLRPK